MDIFQNQYSILNAVFRSVPLTLPIIVFIVYYLTQNIQIFNLFIGTLVINFICVNLFKKLCLILLDIFNITTDGLPILGRFSRPDNCINCGVHYVSETHYSYTSGMPSGHSMLMSFVCVYLYYYINNTYIIKNHNKKNTNNKSLLLFLILFLITIYMMYTRVLMGCHTIQQTIVGSIIGAILGHYYYKYFSKC
tara:strand:- start:58 stop:636 length:579 start_codon:yes stop_codon:yes gene_type:complete